MPENDATTFRVAGINMVPTQGSDGPSRTGQWRIVAGLSDSIPSGLRVANGWPD